MIGRMFRGLMRSARAGEGEEPRNPASLPPDRGEAMLRSGRQCRSGSAAITLGDLRAVLECECERVESSAKGGLLLRVDLTDGLTERALAIAELEAALAVPLVKCVSLVGAGDMCAFSEGRVAIDPRVWPLLRRIRGEYPRILFLNELAQMFLHALVDPWDAYSQLALEFARNGLDVDGFATAIDDDPATSLNLLLAHDEFSKLPPALALEYGLAAKEIMFASAARDEWSTDPDLLTGVDVRPIEAPIDAYSRGLRRSVRLTHEVRRRWRAGRVIHTTLDGWALVDSHGEQTRTLSTAELLEEIRGTPAAEVLPIVIQPAHVNDADRRVPRVSEARAPLRVMPYPFDHWLAFSSDIDWSTSAKVEAAHARLTGALGLPIAGSFYLCTASEPWVGVCDARGEVRHSDVARWFRVGALDTVHAWLDSVHRVSLTRSEADGAWRVPEGAEPLRGAGFLVSARTSLRASTAVVRDEAGRTRFTLKAIAPDIPGTDGCFHAWYELPLDAQDETLDARGWSLHVDAGRGEIESVEFNALSPRAMERAVAACEREGIAPLVFTTHGGGFGVRALANLHAPGMEESSEEWRDQARHDMDQPASPYHLLPLMRRLGVRFFSPIGGASTPHLLQIDQFLTAERMKDGSAAFCFRRFLSRRHTELGLPERWAYGKQASHPPALGFQITDILQRLRWLDPGHGGIVYNHFGHTVGNQIHDRLGWTEETHAAFEALAEHYHPDGGSTMRVWVAPSASVLLYAAMRRGASEHVRVNGSAVAISPWRDDVLGVEIPSLARFGTKLLHGLTIYVDRCADATVTVGDTSIDCFTRNAADASGRESVTILDDSAPIPILDRDRVRDVTVSGAAITREPLGAHPMDAFEFTIDGEAEVVWQVQPVELDAATHVSFELRVTAEIAVEVAFADARGCWYIAGETGASHEFAWRLYPGAIGEWRRHVLSLADRRPSPHDRPVGAMTALRLRVIATASTKGERVAMCRAQLLRPHPALVQRNAAEMPALAPAAIELTG